MNTYNQIAKHIFDYRDSNGKEPDHIYLGFKELAFMVKSELIDCECVGNDSRPTYNGIQVHVVDSISHIGVS